MCDICEDRPDLIEPRANLIDLIEKTPALTWLLLTKRPQNFGRFFGRLWSDGWPANVIAMTTAENQDQFEKRILKLPIGSVRTGISMEPMLGPIDMFPMDHLPDWVIVGGESGNGCREFDPDWARFTRDQCKANGSAFFMKQLGGRMDKRDLLEDLPADLRIREFPNTSKLWRYIQPVKHGEENL